MFFGLLVWQAFNGMVWSTDHYNAWYGWLDGFSYTQFIIFNIVNLLLIAALPIATGFTKKFNPFIAILLPLIYSILIDIVGYSMGIIYSPSLIAQVWNGILFNWRNILLGVGINSLFVIADFAAVRGLKYATLRR